MSSEMDMSDLLGVFLEEAEEQIQRLDNGILHLERNPNDLDMIKEVFRAAHTLKGSSATMGLTPIAELTHVMENLLDLLRAEKMQANPEIADLLLSGTDALRTLISQVSQGVPMDLDTQQLRDALKAMCSGDSVKAASSVVVPTVTESQTGFDGPEGSCRLRVKVADDCLMPSVRVFMVHNALVGLGEVISSDPAEEDLDDIQPGAIVTIVITPIEGVESVTHAIGQLAEVSVLDCILSGGEYVVDSSALVVDSSQTESVTAVETPVNAGSPKTEAKGASEQPAKAIQTVRVGVDRLDSLMNLVAELVIHRTRISQIESDMSSKYEKEELVQGLAETAAHIGRVVTELQEHIMKVRLLPVEQVFNRFPRMVRDLAHKAGKEIEFVMLGQETELDRSILEEIVDPITHLLRNSVDHATEMPDERVALGKPRKARVVLAARQEENRIIIEVEDDGKGINIGKVKEAALKKGATSQEQIERMSDDDALQLIFASGVSTAEKVTDVSGRGVGMDVVRSNIQGLSGSVGVHTEAGKGSRFKISLPLTLAIIQALVTSVDERVYVIPLSAVVETFRCDVSDIRSIDGHPAINFRGSVLPLVNLGSMFDRTVKADHYDVGSSTFVVVNTGASKVGLVVDKLIGEQEVVIKPLGAFFGDLRGIAGATILGDGRVALILDVVGVGALLNKRRFDRSKFETLAVEV